MKYGWGALFADPRSDLFSKIPLKIESHLLAEYWLVYQIDKWQIVFSRFKILWLKYVLVQDIVEYLDCNLYPQAKTTNSRVLVLSAILQMSNLAIMNYNVLFKAIKINYISKPTVFNSST